MTFALTFYRLSIVLVAAFVAAAALVGTAAAQDAPKTERSEPILYGFVPDARQLTRITGEHLEAVYSGKTMRGIYKITRHDDQRFVEQIMDDGKIDYTEGRFHSTGRWDVQGDKLCFYYDEDPETDHCFYEYAYGDCTISYEDNRRLLNGRPVNPERWGAVQQFTSKDFSWPEITSGSKDKTPFVCQALMS